MSESREVGTTSPEIECPGCNEMFPANGWANHRLACDGGNR